MRKLLCKKYYFFSKGSQIKIIEVMMKNFKLIVLILICLLFSLFCSKESNSEGENNSKLSFESFSIKRIAPSTVTSVGKVKKIIKLETTDESVMGTPYYVIKSGQGNYYIGDYDVTGKVLCFDNDGKFVRSFGSIGQGPAEYSRISGFAVGSDESVVILGEDKLIRLDRNGKILAELRLRFHAKDILIVNDLIYISVIDYMYKPPAKKSILTFDMELNETGGIGNYDNRLMKYKNLYLKGLAKTNSVFYYIDFYQLNLNKYDTLTRKMLTLSIPSNNDELDRIWAKDKLIDDEKNYIREHLHRFTSVIGLGDQLYLREICQASKTYDSWILNIDQKKGTIFLDNEMDDLIKRLFNGIRGSEDNNPIIVWDFEDEVEFKKFAEAFPEAQNIKFSLEDNPILTVFEFNKIN